MNESDTVAVIHGITMPFFPMRPKTGSPISTVRQVKHIREMMETGDWIVQPKAGGDRACLAVVEKKIYVQTRHGTWRKRPIKNGEAFLKLRDRTCFDGEILDDEFHPFECLAINGRSLLLSPASEREAVAYQCARLMKQRWLFAKPNQAFLKARRGNLPNWEGVVMKGYMSSYVMLASATQSSGTWLKCKW